MDFKDKYSISIEEKVKIIISSDAYAIGEMIEDLTKTIEKVRLSFL